MRVKEWNEVKDSMRELQDELAALREENKRLEIELRCICKNDGHKLDEIKRLRGENKQQVREIGDLKVQLHKTFDDWVQARDKALIWRRWPEEKPKEKTDLKSNQYIVEREEDFQLDWFVNGEWHHFPSTVIRFAEIPRPEES